MPNPTLKIPTWLVLEKGYQRSNTVQNCAVGTIPKIIEYINRDGALIPQRPDMPLREPYACVPENEYCPTPQYLDRSRWLCVTPPPVVLAPRPVITMPVIAQPPIPAGKAEAIAQQFPVEKADVEIVDLEQPVPAQDIVKLPPEGKIQLSEKPEITSVPEEKGVKIPTWLKYAAVGIGLVFIFR